MEQSVYLPIVGVAQTDTFDGFDMTKSDDSSGNHDDGVETSTLGAICLQNDDDR